MSSDSKIIEFLKKENLLRDGYEGLVGFLEMHGLDQISIIEIIRYLDDKDPDKVMIVNGRYVTLEGASEFWDVKETKEVSDIREPVVITSTLDLEQISLINQENVS